MPPCDAVIEHLPAAINVAVVPETVQIELLFDANETAKPELAVALKFNGVPTVCAAMAPKLIVCAVFAGCELPPDNVAAKTVTLRLAGNVRLLTVLLEFRANE